MKVVELLALLLLVTLSTTLSKTTILEGTHPELSFADKGGETHDITLLFKPLGGSGVYEMASTPRYFWGMQDEDVELEFQYHVKHNRWSDRVILDKLYFSLLYGLSGFPDGDKPRESQKLELAQGWEIGDRKSEFCGWYGITCSEKGKVIKIELSSLSLTGTLPKDLHVLRHLEHIDLKVNNIRGTIPSEWGQMTRLTSLCVAVNQLTGSIPSTFSSMSNLENMSLYKNRLTGLIPEPRDWSSLVYMDFSDNQLEGEIPIFLGKRAPKLVNFFMENNRLSGWLPQDPSGFSALESIDLGYNLLSGTIPSGWMELRSLRDFCVAGNYLSGSIPSEVLRMSNIEALILSDNRLNGTIPRADDIIPGVGRTSGVAPVGGQWSDLVKLWHVSINNNELTGVLPPEFLYGLRASLTTLDIGNNELSGKVPAEIGKLSRLARLQATGNKFTGTLPTEINAMNPEVQLNFTNNLLVGAVPKILCGGGHQSKNRVFLEFGCDAVLCPTGTFHPAGAATLQAGCRPCPVNTVEGEWLNPPLSKILGRTSCDEVEFVHGDLNGDGNLSQREILRLFFFNLIGENWGAPFSDWGDMGVNECELQGIVCVSGSVAKIDMNDAVLCSDGERKIGPLNECLGLPSELAQLPSLEVLTLSRRQFLRGSIPTEFGNISHLKYLDISSSPSMTGTLPSELGRLTNLKYMNLAGCRFNGTLPEELFKLTNLEKLHLSMNAFTGTLPESLGQLEKLKELMFSRTHVSGSVPNSIGNLTMIENLELYGNLLTGTIPASLGNCSGLKRIDLFNNKLNGTLPETLWNLQSLQILHAKSNKLTGTISSKSGDLPFLSWFDVSSNMLHGTIPTTFGASRSIKDFRLGGNMIYEPVPHSLCVNTNVNGGLTRMYGCDGVICPLGTYSDPGHATHADGCKKCPEGTTNMYLGSSICEAFGQEDILSIFFDVMQGDKWNALQKLHWQDTKVNVCKWTGINCDENGEITSVQFPLLGLEDDF